MIPTTLDARLDHAALSASEPSHKNSFRDKPSAKMLKEPTFNIIISLSLKEVMSLHSTYRASK
jgi:hypothetical protein